LSICLTKSDALGLLNLRLTMIRGNLTTIKNTTIRLLRFLFRREYGKPGYY